MSRYQLDFFSVPKDLVQECYNRRIRKAVRDQSVVEIDKDCFVREVQICARCDVALDQLDFGDRQGYEATSKIVLYGHEWQIDSLGALGSHCTGHPTRGLQQFPV